MVQIGFIGSGGRAVREMMDLVQLPDVTIAALCDISEERAAQGLAQLRSRTSATITPSLFADHQRMLDTIELDAVYVSLPPFAHGPAEHAVIDRGLALFVEKPLAVDMGTAKEVAAHIRETGVINAVGYQWRYAEPFVQARSLLSNIPIGLVIAIRLGGLPSVAWWRKQAQSGGMLIEQHTHSVDIMRFIAGDIQSVSAAASLQLLKDVPDIDIDDVSAASVSFESGAVGSIVNSCAINDGQMPNLSNYVHIIAKDLVVAASATQLSIFRPGNDREDHHVKRDESNFQLNKAFVEAVRTKSMKDIRSPYSDSLKTHAVTVGAVQAARQGRVIPLAELLA